MPTSRPGSPRRAPPPERKPGDGGAPGRRQSAARQALGLVILLVVIVPAWVASRPSVDDRGAAAVDARAPARRSRGAVALRDPIIDSHVKEVAVRHGVSPRLVAAMVAVESEFNPRAVSRRGAQGLMQLMPATASDLSVADPFDPRENLEAGVRHLRRLMKRFDHDLPLVLAAYNAGVQAVVRHGGIPPYRETREYVAQILQRLEGEPLPPAFRLRQRERVVTPVTTQRRLAARTSRPPVTR